MNKYAFGDQKTLAESCQNKDEQIEHVMVGGIYRDKVFTSMLSKEVIMVCRGIVTLKDTKYRSNEHVTVPEQLFLRNNVLVS